MHNVRKFKFKFSYMDNKDIKYIVKTYVRRSFKEGNKTLKRLYDETDILNISDAENSFVYET